MKNRNAVLLVIAIVTLAATNAAAQLVENPDFLAGTDGWEIYLSPDDPDEDSHCDGEVLIYDATTLDIRTLGCVLHGSQDYSGSIARLTQTIDAPVSGEYELRLRYNHYMPSHCVNSDQEIVEINGLLRVWVDGWQETLTGYDEGWVDQSFVLTLEAGEHELGFQVEGHYDSFPGIYCSPADFAYLDLVDLEALATPVEALSLSAIKSLY